MALSWRTKVVNLNTHEGEGDGDYWEDWEPFAVVVLPAGAELLFLKKQEEIEPDKSSVHHPQSFYERYER